MLTIVLLLTGDLQEAQMAGVYLRENYAGEEYERILVYCGEDSAVVDFLDADDSVVLVDGRGAGVAASCNTALSYAHGREILFSAVPYILLPAAVQAMQRAAEGDGAALVVPMLKTPLGLDRAQALSADRCAPYQDVEGLRRVSEKLSVDSAVSLVLASLNFCFLTQRQAMLDLGGFSEEFRTTPFLMLDLCLRFWQKEQPCIAAHGAFAHENAFEMLYDEEDETCFTQKYGLRYPYSFIPRMELLAHMDLQKPGLSVLEVGCACGATLLTIRNAAPEARLYGIELDERAADFARHFAVVEALDVEKLHKPLWQGTFDYIVLGDVIEHLREPWQAMQHLAALLKPGGRVIVSVPNVLHVSVFRMMLQGRWAYEDAGILDRTHLRFFTRTEILTLLQDADLEPQEVFDSKIEESEEEAALLAQLAALLPPEVDTAELHAFQWMVVAQKR